jgi:branched-subunit amino acid aminotransferase/4-amino-4-deoxychorismate lyase
MLTGNKLITPPVSEGCLNGVMRKQVLEFAKKMDHLEVVEEAISPFDLQKQTNYLSQTLSRNTAHNKIQEKRI